MKQGTMTHQEPLITFETDKLKAQIDLSEGGKIRSFFSKRTNMEYLFHDFRGHFPATNYSNHDISGFDECFPTVGESVYPDGKYANIPMGDHGLLWQTPWDLKLDRDRAVLTKNVPQFETVVERTVQLDSTQSLRLDYRITNHGSEPLKYLYAGHILLAEGPKVEALFPAEMKKIFVTYTRGVPGLKAETWIDWPPPLEMGLGGILDTQRNSVVKFFSPKLTQGTMAIRHHDLAEEMRIDFDVNQLPYAGVLFSQGDDAHGDGNFKDRLLTGLEPTSAIGDDLAMCKTTGTLQSIAPGQEIRFWIRLALAP